MGGLRVIATAGGLRYAKANSTLAGHDLMTAPTFTAVTPAVLEQIQAIVGENNMSTTQADIDRVRQDAEAKVESVKAEQGETQQQQFKEGPLPFDK